MTETKHDPVVALCSRCGGTIEVGQKVHVIGENEVMSTGELSLIKNLEMVCETCYPLLEVGWPDSVEHEQGNGKKALRIIMAEKAPPVSPIPG